jgi:endonuclease/exonuclease/phosphatase family metal-dependent hydrolase
MNWMAGLLLVSAAIGWAGNSTATSNIVAGSFAPPERPRAALKIVDWNIHKGWHMDAILKTVRAQSPDICLFQEVDYHDRRTGDRNVAGDLARALHMNYVFGKAFRELAQGTPDRPGYAGQATLTKLPILSTRVLAYKRQTDFWKPHWYVPNWPFLQRRTGGRVALVTELDHGGKPVVIYNLHLESRGFGGARRGQLRETLRDVRRYPPDTPVIIAGDLNTKYRPSVFVARLERAGFHSCFGQRHVRTHVIAGALDWVFVRGPIACEGTEVVRGSHASDHDPVVTTIVPHGSTAVASSAAKR